MSGADLVSESVVIRSLRRFREKYFPPKGKVCEDEEGLDPSETLHPGSLDNLPVDLHFVIMTFMSPLDICRLGATSRYWRALVRDPLLWRFFLLRDMPTWTSIDHMTMPQLELLDAPLTRGEDQPDFMSEYLRSCPSCRQRWLPSRPAFQILTSFLNSLVAAPEPRYAMLGPGMEQLDVSLVSRLLNSPHVLLVSGTSRRQINGVGSGISFIYRETHRFNILTLYSTNRAERERAKMLRRYSSEKLFTREGSNASGQSVYRPAAQVQQVCEEVDGFIYVVNAEACTDEREFAQIRALLDHGRVSTPRPLLVLSCTSSEVVSGGSVHCVDVARRLGLSQLENPWRVQDTVVDSLTGLLDGISWLLRCSGVHVRDD